MLLKGGLHNHTTCSDGKLTPQEVADVYESLGYDFIAFTDHAYLFKPAHNDTYDAVESSMIIFKGIELTVFEKGYVHVTQIHGDEEELHAFAHIGEYDLTFDQAMERLTEVAKRYPIDVVEVTTKGFLDKEFDVPEIGYPRIAVDDSHTRIGCGRAWIEMDCARNKDSILRAVKKGRSWNCFTHGR